MIKNKTLAKLLIKNFIIFSLIIIGVFWVATKSMNVVGYKYMESSIKDYFANYLIQENYMDIDTNKLEEINGWINILDTDFNNIYSKGKVGITKTKFTMEDIVLLLNGEYELNNETIYASIKFFQTNKGQNYIGLVCIPKKYISIKPTLINVPNTIKPFILIFSIGILVFSSGYISTVLLLSKRINNKITIPINLITSALNKVRQKKYNTRLEFEAENEFNNMKDSFNYMITELEKLFKEIEIEKQEKEQLIANISHDLKTPITIINGYIMAIVNGYVKEEEKIEDYYNIILKNSEKLTNLIEILLKYSKLSCKDFKLNLETVNLSEFVRLIVANNYKLCKDKGKVLLVDIPEENINIQIDKIEMERVLQNLINNAIQHNPEGTEIFITIEQNDSIYIIIADNGVTFDNILVDTIFKPFVCGDISRNNGERSGLGLSIVSKIVEKHNGTISIKTNWQKYSKAFIIKF